MTLLVSAAVPSLEVHPAHEFDPDLRNAEAAPEGVATSFTVEATAR